jgi:hypothetical protein
MPPPRPARPSPGKCPAEGGHRRALECRAYEDEGQAAYNAGRALKIVMGGDPTPFEITEELLADELMPILCTFNASLFAGLSRSDTSPEYCGSGTFVRAGGRSCLLTAAHVWRRVRRRECVLLGIDHSVSATKDHPLAIETRFTDVRYLSAESPSEEWGPDLALITLPDLHADFARNNKAFYDLDRRRGEAITSTVDHTTGLWAMVGAPSEHCGFVNDEFVMQTYVLGSTIANWTVREDFDYLDFAIKRKGRPKLVESYGGYSGAGLWRCGLQRMASGKVECTQYALEGVAFFQGPEQDADEDTFIRCHGRASIYRHALSAHIV